MSAPCLFVNAITIRLTKILESQPASQNHPHLQRRQWDRVPIKPLSPMNRRTITKLRTSKNPACADLGVQNGRTTKTAPKPGNHQNTFQGLLKVPNNPFQIAGHPIRGPAGPFSQAAKKLRGRKNKQSASIAHETAQRSKLGCKFPLVFRGQTPPQPNPEFQPEVYVLQDSKRSEPREESLIPHIMVDMASVSDLQKHQGCLPTKTNSRQNWPQIRQF